jgi:hypothetical protein
MKYEDFLKKKALNPEWFQAHHQKTLERQRLRYQDPEVKRKHALACANSKEKRGVVPPPPQEPLLFREAPFSCTFD